MNHSFCHSYLYVFATIFLIAGVMQTAYGQGMHTTSASMALGGGGGAYINGYHANFINPANLMLPDRNTRTTLGVLGGLNTSAGGRLANIGLYNQHFTKGEIIDTERALKIADDWFGNGSGSYASVGLDVSVVPIGFSHRRDRMAFGSAVRVRSMAATGMSKGLFELALTGLDSDVFSDGKAVNMNMEMMAMTEWSAGFAMEVWRNQQSVEPGMMRLFAGVAPKLLFGMGYANLALESVLTVKGDETESSILHDFDYRIQTIGNLSDDMLAYYEERRLNENRDAILSDFVTGDSFGDMGSIHGMGMGLDIGVTGEWYIRDISLPVIGSGPQILRASISLTDIGGINYRKNPGDFRAKNTFLWDGLNIDFEYIDEEHDGDITNYYEFVLEDSIGSDIYGNFAPVETNNHRVGLTPIINIGGALSMGKLGVMMDIGKGWNRRGINSRRMYMALGTEYYPVDFIPIRLGMRMGGYSGVNLSFGTGVELKNFEFTAGIMRTPSSRRSGINLSAAWSGFIVRF